MFRRQYIGNSDTMITRQFLISGQLFKQILKFEVKKFTIFSYVIQKIECLSLKIAFKKSYDIRLPTTVV